MSLSLIFFTQSSGNALIFIDMSELGSHIHMCDLSVITKGRLMMQWEGTRML